MTLDEAIEVLKEHQLFPKSKNTYLLSEPVLVEAIGLILAQLEHVTTKLGESLPNGGFCALNCNNSMKPTLKHDTE